MKRLRKQHKRPRALLTPKRTLYVVRMINQHIRLMRSLNRRIIAHDLIIRREAKANITEYIYKPK